MIFVRSSDIYLGASDANNKLLTIKPEVLAKEISTPLVRARALRLGILARVQAVLIGVVGYACDALVYYPSYSSNMDG